MCVVTDMLAQMQCLSLAPHTESPALQAYYNMVPGDAPTKSGNLPHTTTEPTQKKTTAVFNKHTRNPAVADYARIFGGNNAWLNGTNRG